MSLVDRNEKNYWDRKNGWKEGTRSPLPPSLHQPQGTANLGHTVTYIYNCIDVCMYVGVCVFLSLNLGLGCGWWWSCVCDYDWSLLLFSSCPCSSTVCVFLLFSANGCVQYKKVVKCVSLSLSVYFIFFLSCFLFLFFGENYTNLPNKYTDLPYGSENYIVTFLVNPKSSSECHIWILRSLVHFLKCILHN